VVIILFIVLLFLSAFFSGSETALLSLNQMQLKRMEERDKKSTHTIFHLLSKPKTLFFTILTGNTLVNTAASAYATMVALKVFGPKGVGLSIGFMFFVLILFGEIIPKTYAYMFAESFSAFSIRPLKVIIKLFAPIRVILFLITDNLINKLGFIAPRDTENLTEDEIKSLVDIGHREGIVEADEKEMIYGVFDFKGQAAKDVMTPKPNMNILDFDMSQNEILTYVKEAKHSRLPVYRNNMDNIIGVVYAKDILLDSSKSLKDIMREAYFIPESQKIDKLLSDLQKRSIQMAIVSDEYGAVTGLITMEDMLEEIVGEIVDEYDKEEPLIVKIDTRTYRVSGLLHIDEAKEKFGLNVDTEEVNTVGGFVTFILQRIPKENEEFKYGGFNFCVSKVEKHRVKEILLTKI